MNTTETKVTPWQTCVDGPWFPSLPHGGYVAYRIWQQFDGRRWFQRHEWMQADNVTRVDPWIDGASGWCADAQAVEGKAA